MTHPARYSDALLPVFAEWLAGCERVLDPFAGTGRIHELTGYDTVGVELEPEWASLHPRTIVGNALALPFATDSFDAVCTSPTYGNRMADHHQAKDDSRRITYRHSLGRPLHRDNSGAMPWGPDYRRFHDQAWREAVRVLRPGGRFILNTKDHLRGDRVQPVSAWHVRNLMDIQGMRGVTQRAVETPGMRFGANTRVSNLPELVVMLVKPVDAERRWLDDERRRTGGLETVVAPQLAAAE